MNSFYMRLEETVFAIDSAALSSTAVFPPRGALQLKLEPALQEYWISFIPCENKG